MIKLQDYTPEIYYKESRDFQLLGRLYDLVLNALKTDADLIYNIPISDNSNDKLLDLMALTLGFKANNHYNTVQLRAICKVFPEILKNKGSIKAIQIACNALFNAAGLSQSLDYDFTDRDKHTELNLYIPQEFGDITIITNLLTYILPAGLSCNIIRELRIKEEAITNVAVDSIFKIYNRGEGSVGELGAILYDNNLLAKIPRIRRLNLDFDSTDEKDENKKAYDKKIRELSDETYEFYDDNPALDELIIDPANPDTTTPHYISRRTKMVRDLQWDKTHNRGTKTSNGSISTGEILRGFVEDKVGFIANGTIYRPKIDLDDDE